MAGNSSRDREHPKRTAIIFPSAITGRRAMAWTPSGEKTSASRGSDLVAWRKTALPAASSCSKSPTMEQESRGGAVMEKPRR